MPQRAPPLVPASRMSPRPPTARARFIDLGASLLAGSAADFGNLIADETEKWGKVIKFAGIKPE